MLRVAVFGCGYWGPKVIRNLHALDGCEVRVACDSDPERVEAVRKTYPTIRRVDRTEDVLGDPDVDGVVICTPVRTHFPLARAALEAGKHVLVTKPMTDSVESAETLVELAEARGLTLQVDHTFIYSGAVQKAREIIESGAVGELLYADFVRVNLGLFQTDTSVLWDLAPHDLSILDYLVDASPRWVSAIGTRHYGQFEDQAYVTVGYDGSFIGHLHVNWLAPVKVRSTLIGGSRRMIVYDDLEPSEKVRVYDKGVTLAGDAGSREQALVDYRVGDMYAPHIDKTEPLQKVCESFRDAIVRGVPCPTDGAAGLSVVRMLEAAQESIRKNGERIFLESGR
ncbi:MAG: Gfo/Idh/MocA family oxidoreductase [Proteobacteria bacterium]|nr:Gfo/Idh/MocA family oxidoreductase [Pseudomonadota bacterium]